MGVAVQSRYFSVGSVVTWAEAGVGAVATQAMVKPGYGPDGLALMRRGRYAADALHSLVADDKGRAVRQVAMIDARGNVAAHTGERCIAAAGHITGGNFSVQANMMVDDSVWPAMHDAYLATKGDLADRMLAALDAAQAAGGDIRGQQSAAMLIVSGTRGEAHWKERLLELRIEDHPQPLVELRRLLRLHRAYGANSEGDRLITEGKHDDAALAFARARELAPENDELQFWSALTLFRSGSEDEALALFREAFARNPALVDLVPRLVPLGLVKDDAAVIERITSQR